MYIANIYIWQQSSATILSKLSQVFLNFLFAIKQIYNICI